jgi:hypothetical protein
MSRWIKRFLFLSGFWIFFSWGFRLYILWVRWETDPSPAPTLVFGLLYLLIGGFLVYLGRLGDRAHTRHYTGLIGAAIFMIGYWAVRLARFFLYPAVDPNPRSHLHMTVTFLVVGVLLLVIGIKGRHSRANPHHHK